jgi:LPS O-antigen subunit length determinant protein (WzzB/FepE family)
MQDTYKQAVVGVLNKLLASDLLLPYQRVSLENKKAVLMEGTHSRGYSNSVYIDLKGFDTSCNISIEEHNLWDESILITDENGDDYAPARLNVSISYPSHGSCSLEVLEHRLNFFSTVLKLCKEVEAEYSGELVTLVRTGEEKRVQAERKLKAELDKKLLNLQLSLQKNLRVGGFKSAPTSDIPEGEYLLGGDKTYRLVVAKGCGTLIRLT